MTEEVPDPVVHIQHDPIRVQKDDQVLGELEDGAELAFLIHDPPSGLHRFRDVLHVRKHPDDPPPCVPHRVHMVAELPHLPGGQGVRMLP